MANKIKAGPRHTLLLYKANMSSLWQLTLVLGCVLGGVWWFADVLFPQATELVNNLLLVGAVLALAFTVFGFFASNMAFVQVHANFLYLATPFLRLKIAYRRMQRVHPAEIRLLFDFKSLRWTDRDALEPFSGHTAVVIDLSEYPLNRRLLGMFLPPQMLHPKRNGLVLLVADWMALSSQLDSAMSAWRETQRPSKTPTSGYSSLYSAVNKK